MSNTEKDSNDPNRGYSIDTGKKKRRNVLLGLGALILVVAVAAVAINATKSDEASGKEFGTNLKIGYNSAFASEERLLDLSLIHI